MILVAGGSGTLGSRLVRLLVDGGHAVRVLTRDRRRAEQLPKEVEVVTGDLRRPDDLDAAVRGCATVVSAVHGFAGPGSPSPEAIDRDGNRALIRAAAGKVEHFILLSVQAARPDHPMSLHRAKHAAEQTLKESGLPFTIIRPTAFFETWLNIIGGPLAEKRQALVFGPGRNPINFVSVRDVAALIGVSLGDPSLRGETLEIGGEDLPFLTLAQRLIEASGQPASIKHIPLAVLRAMSVLARPFAPVFARQARAAVVMNTTDMTFSGSIRSRCPTVPTTALADLLTGSRG